MSHVGPWHFSKFYQLIQPMNLVSAKRCSQLTQTDSPFQMVFTLHLLSNFRFFAARQYLPFEMHNSGTYNSHNVCTELTTKQSKQYANYLQNQPRNGRRYEKWKSTFSPLVRNSKSVKWQGKKENYMWEKNRKITKKCIRDAKKTIVQWNVSRQSVVFLLFKTQRTIEVVQTSYCNTHQMTWFCVRCQSYVSSKVHTTIWHPAFSSNTVTAAMTTNTK